MNYIERIKAAGFGENPLYQRDDIGVSRLFYDLHSDVIRYVIESKTWYIYDGRRWVKSSGIFRASELCKDFAKAVCEYAEICHADDDDFVKYARKLTGRRNRDGILADARSIAPISLTEFDRDKLLLNCQNGTLNLRNFALQPHSAADLITKMAAVKYDHRSKCERWEQFIDEVMCGDKETAVYLQKAFGYSLTGLTDYECFFILYGQTSRNGKTTLTESIGNLMDDYCVTAQPQTFSRRNSDGSAASPDTARLKGARLINIPEPEREMVLNAALMKQLTGGDTYTGRYLNENLFEFQMEGKPFINTNHKPHVTDDTIFASGRVKIIPFNRHFSESEQDKGLKREFRKAKAKSGIFNWLIDGWRLIQETGFDAPSAVVQATAEYRQEADVIGAFLSERTVPAEGKRLATRQLYLAYQDWAKSGGYKAADNRAFVQDLRRRFEIGRDYKLGNVVLGMELASGQFFCGSAPDYVSDLSDVSGSASGAASAS